MTDTNEDGQGFDVAEIYSNGGVYFVIDHAVRPARALSEILITKLKEKSGDRSIAEIRTIAKLLQEAVEDICDKGNDLDDFLNEREEEIKRAQEVRARNYFAEHGIIRTDDQMKVFFMDVLFLFPKREPDVKKQPLRLIESKPEPVTDASCEASAQDS